MSNKTLKTVVVASKNPVKIAAVERAFQRVFPQQGFLISGIHVPSGVKAQPDTEAECLQGATQRAHLCKNIQPEADFWVGIEAGIERQADEMASFSWTVILSRDGRMGKATTGISYLPPAIIEHINHGMELGEAMDLVFKEKHSKQKNGAVGLLTGDAITRGQVHENAVILALIPFKNPDLYPIKPDNLSGHLVMDG